MWRQAGSADTESVELLPGDKPFHADQVPKLSKEANLVVTGEALLFLCPGFSGVMGPSADSTLAEASTAVATTTKDVLQKICSHVRYSLTSPSLPFM